MNSNGVRPSARHKADGDEPLSSLCAFEGKRVEIILVEDEGSERVVPAHTRRFGTTPGNTHPVSAEGVCAYWNSVARSSAPLVLLRKKLGEARFGELASAVQQKLVARFGGGPLEMRLVALMGMGHR